MVNNDIMVLSVEFKTGFSWELEKISVTAVNLVKEGDLEPWRRQRTLQSRDGGEEDREKYTAFQEIQKQK